MYTPEDVVVNTSESNPYIHYLTMDGNNTASAVVTVVYNKTFPEIIVEVHIPAANEAKAVDLTVIADGNTMDKSGVVAASVEAFLKVVNLLPPRHAAMPDNVVWDIGSADVYRVFARALGLLDPDGMRSEDDETLLTEEMKTWIDEKCPLGNIAANAAWELPMSVEDDVLWRSVPELAIGDFKRRFADQIEAIHKSNDGFEEE